MQHQVETNDRNSSLGILAAGTEQVWDAVAAHRKYWHSHHAPDDEPNEHGVQCQPFATSPQAIAGQYQSADQHQPNGDDRHSQRDEVVLDERQTVHDRTQDETTTGNERAHGNAHPTACFVS